MATSQHRRVFVGNIPYDVTEEQLVQICEEVGPVVSFRLVIDRETGKPKGYGFCEYKDEETALSARRNLQGYEINGRQLRVDFAENDKNADRNQGRGGPGTATNLDFQKQSGGPQAVSNAGMHQPIGIQAAIAASSVMAGALGGAQSSREMRQNVLPGQPAMSCDPLTLHLAKMSKHQLNTVMLELKTMATQNKEQARQLLLANPQLVKAIFEVEIMLGMVTPQVLQKPNIRQSTGPTVKLSSQDIAAQGLQQSTLPPLPGITLAAQNEMQPVLIPRGQESQMPSMYPNPFPQSQYAVRPQFPTQAPPQMTQLLQKDFTSQGPLLPSHPGASTLPHARLPSIGVQPGTSGFPIPDMMKREGGHALTSVSGPSQILNAPLFANQVVPKVEETPKVNKQVPQLPPEVDSALLEQVLSLTPEQLSSLPPDQQQQVIQLQQMLRKSS